MHRMKGSMFDGQMSRELDMYEKTRSNSILKIKNSQGISMRNIHNSKKQ